VAGLADITVKLGKEILADEQLLAEFSHAFAGLLHAHLHRWYCVTIRPGSIKLETRGPALVASLLQELIDHRRPVALLFGLVRVEATALSAALTRSPPLAPRFNAGQRFATSPLPVPLGPTRSPTKLPMLRSPPAADEGEN